MNIETCSRNKFLEHFLADSFEINSFGLVGLDETWKLGPRVTEDHLIFYLSDGSIQATIENNSICINPQELFWLQPGPKHKFSLNRGIYKASIFFFRFRSGNSKGYRLNENFLKFPNNPALKTILSGIFLESEISPLYRSVFIKSKLSELFCKVLSSQNFGISKLEGLDNKKRQKIHNFILSNIHKNLTLKQMADCIELNPDYFSRQFKKTFGLNPSAWIKKEKIRLANAYLYESNMTISEIAFKLGYEEISFFSRQFKEITGVAPSKKRM